MKKALIENFNFCVRNTINHLPDDLKWLPHNIVSHPLSEVLFQIGLVELSKYTHDITIPEEINEKSLG